MENIIPARILILNYTYLGFGFLQKHYPSTILNDFMIFTTVQILVRGGLTMPRPYIVDLTFYQKMTKPVKILQRSAKNYAPNALVVKCALLILPDLDKSLLRFLPDLLNSVWLQL